MDGQLSGRQMEDRWIIRLTGDLTREEETRLFNLCPWQDNEAVLVKHIVFDVGERIYINSAGIALLIRYAREAIKRGYTLCACGLSQHYEKIFKIVGLLAYIELFPDMYSVEETLKSRAAYEE